MVYGVYIDVKIGEGGMRLKRADPPRPASVIDQNLVTLIQLFYIYITLYS